MFCKKCGHKLGTDAAFCPECGTKVEHLEKIRGVEDISPPATELSSEESVYLDKWSWGAFGLSIIWLLLSKLGWYSLLTLLVLIPGIGPVIGLGLTIYFSVAGRRKSWATGKWDSFSQFKERQRKLDKAGKIFTVLWILFAVFGVIATLTLFQLGDARSIARDTKRIADVNQLRTAAEFYFEDNAVYPPAIDQAHVGKYLSNKAVPVDPLTGQPYGYLSGPAAARTAFVVFAELEHGATALSSDADIKVAGFDGSRELCTSAPDDCIYDQGYIPE